MTEVPEAITARLQEIEDNIVRELQKQQKDAAQAAQLVKQAVDLKVAIADRRRGIRGWKLQRDALRYAVDAIEGRVIYAGTVEAPATEPFVERVVVEPPGAQAIVERRPPPWFEKPVAANPPRRSTDTVYEVMKRLGPAPAHKIAAKAGFDNPRGIGSLLGRLRKEGRVVRTEEGLWEPADQ